MDIKNRVQVSGFRFKSLLGLGMARSFFVSLFSRALSGHSKSGQAVAELVVALLAIVVVIAALLQIGLLGYEQTQTMLQATEQAHRRARADEYLVPAVRPEFILTWNEGRDEAPYSVDDTRSYADVENIYDQVLDVARPDALSRYVPGNTFSETGGEDILETSFFVMGTHAKPNIPLLPAIRNLMYEKEEVDVDSTVYMIWTKGLY